MPLSPEDDVEHEWAVRLVPLLTGKARSAYVLTDINVSENYDKMKEAILAKYEITTDTYRRGFCDVHPGETLHELSVRLNMFCKWVRPETGNIKDMSKLLILEQLTGTSHNRG